MEKIVLKARKRDVIGKAVKALRRNGEIPAVVYGNASDNQNLAVLMHDFEKVFKEAGSSAIVTLEIEGEKEKNVLIHDVAESPMQSLPEHIDFYEVSMTEKIQTSVPLHFIGDS
jgi:large subunit ribosomal protein L25